MRALSSNTRAGTPTVAKTRNPPQRLVLFKVCWHLLDAFGKVAREISECDTHTELMAFCLEKCAVRVVMSSVMSDGQLFVMEMQPLIVFMFWVARRSKRKLYIPFLLMPYALCFFYFTTSELINKQSVSGTFFRAFACENEKRRAH